MDKREGTIHVEFCGYDLTLDEAREAMQEYVAESWAERQADPDAFVPPHALAVTPQGLASIHIAHLCIRDQREALRQVLPKIGATGVVVVNEEWVVTTDLNDPAAVEAVEAMKAREQLHTHPDAREVLHEVGGAEGPGSVVGAAALEQPLGGHAAGAGHRQHDDVDRAERVDHGRRFGVGVGAGEALRAQPGEKLDHRF